MRILYLVVAVALVSALSFAGCSCGGSPPPGGDGGNRDSGSGSGRDAGPDAGADAGANGGVGQYCSNAAGGPACPTGLQCITEPNATGGFCTELCTTTCPGSSSCFTPGGGAPNYCVETCSAPTDCAADQICASTGTSGYCIPDCRTHADVCPSGQVCNPSFGFCTPSGTNGFGTACGVDAGACSSGETCLGLQGGNGGQFCTQTCTANPNSCPATPAGAQCDLNTAGGTMFCGFPCVPDAGASACPATLTCGAVATAGGTFYLCQ